MPFARRHLPAILFAAAVLSMSGPWASASNTSDVVEPFFRGFLGLSPEVSIFLHNAARKAGHVTAYAVFGMLALRAVRGTAPAGARAAFAALFLAVGLALADEALQSMSPERTATVRDVLMDMGGGAFGIALSLALAKRRSRAAPRSPDASPAPAP